MGAHFHGGFEHDHDEAGYHEHTGWTDPSAEPVELVEPPADATVVAINEADAGRAETDADARVAIAEIEAGADVAIAEADAAAAVAIAEADARARTAEAGAADDDQVDDELADAVEQIEDELEDALHDELADLEEIPDAGDVVEVTVPPQVEEAAAQTGLARSPVVRRSRLSRRRR